MRNLLAQLIGLAAFSLSVFSFQGRTQKKILLFQLLASMLWCVHFSMLGAYIGAMLNGIGLARAFIFARKEQRWARSRFWLVLFVLLSIGAGVISWEGWYSVLPIIGMIFTTVSFWMEDAKLVRLLAFPSSPCWLVYNGITGSIAGILTESFAMCSILIAMWRYEWSPAARAAKRAAGTERR